MERALSNFVSSVVARGENYINLLTNAQSQIIKSVHEVYGVQIDAVAESLNADSRYGQGAAEPGASMDSSTSAGAARF